MEIVYVFGSLLLVLLVVGFGVWLKARGRGIPKHRAAELQAAFGRASMQSDAHRRVMDTEKVLDMAFKDLGFEGTFADKLRKAQPRLKDPQAVWNAHKLRNRIAHEVDVRMDNVEAARAVSAFARALKDVC
jgi:hypothetical protein